MAKWEIVLSAEVDNVKLVLCSEALHCIKAKK